MASDAPPFDPFKQSFTLLDMQELPHQFSIPELEELTTFLVQSSIVFAAQLGGSLVLLIALLLLAKPEKRRSPIFILNALSLSINFILTLLNCLYFTGPFSEIAAILLQDYSRVPQVEYAKSITMTILSLILLLCAEASLVLQVRVVCVTLRRIHRQALFLVSVLLVMMAASFRFAFCIENSHSILSTAYTTDLIWLQSAMNITTTISLCWFCAVFVGKLAFALIERRKLGLRKFGPMQVIFIMGIQSFIVPAIFSLLPYISSLPSMPSNVLTVICIFLPLSSLWASTTATTRSAQPASSRQPFRPSSSNIPGGGPRHRLLSSIISAGTTSLLVGLDDDRGPPGLGQSSVPSHAEGVVLLDITDLEKQNLPVGGKS